MAADLPRRFPPFPGHPPSPRLYLNPPRASLLRFRHSPLFLPVGIELAPSSSLSAVAAELRSAAVVASDLLPLRHRLLQHRRVLADLIHPFVSPADRRNAAVLVDPSHAAASLRFGRHSRRRRRPGRRSAVPVAAGGDHRGAGALPPAGRAGLAALGRAEWLPRGARPSAARALGKRSFGEEVLGGVLAYTPVERL
uniref:Zinc knuckle domain-like n=1 Tax=Oryza sativa subsp. japonica TaxID=39947 RepID=Q6K284_ORYSJ|nr:zinc knuckle domain-like [Oryza sativa Japonica Group]